MSIENTAVITRLTKRGGKALVLEAANSVDDPKDIRGVCVLIGSSGRVELRFQSCASSPYEYLIELPREVIRRAYASLGESIGKRTDEHSHDMDVGPCHRCDGTALLSKPEPRA